MMEDVTDAAGWTVDPYSLSPVVTDPDLVRQQLAGATAEDRVWLLGLLGEHDRALAEGHAVLEDPMVKVDPWRALLLVADVHRMVAEFDVAEQLQISAWKHAIGRVRQATTLHQIGKRLWHQNYRDLAASAFGLAVTLRRGFVDADVLATSQHALDRMREELHYDAIVLAGGAGSRMGADKPTQRVAGWPLVDHVLLAVSGATCRIVVGPQRMALSSPTFRREDPPGAGPVAAIGAALRDLSQPVTLLLAADLPFIADGLEQLRHTIELSERDAAVYVDTTGHVNYLAAAWRTSSLVAAVERLSRAGGAPVRALYEGADVGHIPDFDGLGVDCDTPADLRTARERMSKHEPGRYPDSFLAWPRLQLHAPS